MIYSFLIKFSRIPGNGRAREAWTEFVEILKNGQESYYQSEQNFILFFETAGSPYSERNQIFKIHAVILPQNLLILVLGQFF